MLLLLFSRGCLVEVGCMEPERQGFPQWKDQNCFYILISQGSRNSSNNKQTPALEKLLAKTWPLAVGDLKQLPKHIIFSMQILKKKMQDASSKKIEDAFLCREVTVLWNRKASQCNPLERNICCSLGNSLLSRWPSHLGP